ncbi:hypothetical protein AK812_SmicGene22588 [Symbiodinium microadriaticum]|uniref:Uncharacterized protein n=1 Tax=Symbiodinium microadriaticum TaxID=2951 RepID=A0A1Q9DJG2_SYMMI|nr:hypothetical protein AK812_SmicGene22588 [Symbiodinium microadriaticum]
MDMMIRRDRMKSVSEATRRVELVVQKLFASKVLATALEIRSKELKKPRGAPSAPSGGWRCRSGDKVRGVAPEGVGGPRETGDDRPRVFGGWPATGLSLPLQPLHCVDWAGLKA